jgi:dihydroxy-acid dehydratase
MAVDSGRRAVEMVMEDLKPRDVLTGASFANAVVALMALGGVDQRRDPSRRDGAACRAGAVTGPFRRSVVPRTGAGGSAAIGRFLMEDFFEAGGLRGLLSRIPELLDLSARTVAGGTLGDAIAGARVWSDEVIRPRDKPLQAEGGLLVLRGNLAQDGAVLKAAAASRTCSTTPAQRWCSKAGPISRPAWTATTCRSRRTA